MEISFRVNSEGLAERRRRGRRYPMEQRETMHPSVDAAPLSGLQGRFFYFIVRPTRQQSKGLLPGVRVYRDGFRIEPFGSERADWLGVAEKRAKRAGHAHIVPSRLFGFVTISRKEHPDLKDTTSREALVDTGAARALVNVLREQLNFLESSIQTDIAQPRWDESRRRKVTEFERAKLQTLSIMSLGLAHELRQPLQSIRTEAAVITKRLKQLAIDDPYIASAQKNIDQSIERIDGNIRLIAAISAGSTDDVCAVDLAKVLSDECQLFKTRCAALGISLDTELPAEQWAELNSTTVTAILINLLQNAIDAFTEVRDDRSRRILVSVTKQDRTNRIEVSDNAYGIPPQVQGSIFKRFASKKTGGWGVGLYNCQLMARAHGGEISFETRDRLGTTFRVKLPDVTSTNARPNPDSR
jgi:signal transduction histidine kinase